MSCQQPEPLHNPQHIDALGQLVAVSKQNQILKTQLISVKQELTRIIISRDKYKARYHHLLKLTQRAASPSLQIKSTFRRKPPGTITGQPQKLTKPIMGTVQKSKGVQSNQIKQCVTSRLDEDSYGLAEMMNKRQNQSYLPRIYQHLETIMQNFEMMRTLGTHESILEAVMPKLTSIEQAVIENARKIKSDIIDHFDVQLGQKLSVFKQESNHSGCSPPVKDVNHYGYYSNSLRTDDGKPNYQIKNEQKLGKSKSMQTLIREAKSKNKFMGNEKQKGCDSEQPTKQKWAMLNQIGHRLQNWRFSNSDSELLDKSDEQGIE